MIQVALQKYSSIESLNSLTSHNMQRPEFHYRGFEFRVARQKECKYDFQFWAPGMPTDNNGARCTFMLFSGI